MGFRSKLKVDILIWVILDFCSFCSAIFLENYYNIYTVVEMVQFFFFFIVAFISALKSRKHTSRAINETVHALLRDG